MLCLQRLFCELMSLKQVVKFAESHLQGTFTRCWYQLVDTACPPVPTFYTADIWFGSIPMSYWLALCMYIILNVERAQYMHIHACDALQLASQ